ncbi:BREX-1 system adenine-specific DNA-methyltransferase PglX [Aquirufa antheringensis]|uniref:BREX-1 system adenine-specific DNA-methyltransferase PglX n=1 Tax=Aquirufa antheringensis TaxID=2516559 RepID=UPI0022A981BE|nr:BREX-1 system adenine-specific DNA-methyltransferase PglX [Aquirufa antheringensis]MCZ2489269.1 BREX-1 system adenine-specific DNA-methyltransferase PglX [Aquirufa antheringensis]
MNTNQLKKFAQQARKKLLEQIGAKLEFVLNNDTPELREKSSQIKLLKDAISKSGKSQLIDKVAYTWFNRFMALRFMDVNDYQPLGVKIITPKEGYTLPEILDDAKQGHISDELQVNRPRIFDLIDGKIPSSNGQNEAFKELLVGACNHLNTVLPFLFERIKDYTELLLPDDLTSELSIVQDIRDGMSEEDCSEVEVIGWLYQFYISEKKDEVFASKSSVKKEDIPAATQLFTPRWIVEYMVQNTVGKLWLQNKPNSKLREHMPYFIESPSVTNEDYLKLNSVEELTLLDQACGSGHILVYGFDLLYKIYEEEGYNSNEIPELIIKNNLHGFEIDERASQLAGLALLLKARSYNRRFFRKEVEPNILCYKDLVLTKDEFTEAFNQIRLHLSEELIYDLTQMQQATNYGSLISPKTSSKELEKVLETVLYKGNNGDIFLKYQLEQLKFAIQQLLLLSRKYHCIVDNPPYMGGGNMNKTLSEYVKVNYPDSKADLMACFIEAGINMLKSSGFLGMINQHSWMFLSSYENLREKLVNTVFFDTNLHLGARTFPEIGGEVVQNTAFTFYNRTLELSGVYFRLVDLNTTEQKRLATININSDTNSKLYFITNQKDFIKIPGSPIAYWAKNKIISLFKQHNQLGDISDLKSGISTGDNERFYRHWSEVEINKIRLNGNKILHIKNNTLSDNKKWFAVIRGGEYTKWFGNQEYVLNLKDNGNDIRNSGKNHRLRTPDDYFIEGITWSRIASGKSAFRIKTENVNFGENSPCLFPKNISAKVLLGVLNSPIPNHVLEFLSPTLSFQATDISKIPIPNEENLSSEITKIEACILLSEQNWNQYEISWGFNQNELIKHKSQDIEETYDLYQQYWKNKFFQLHKNEEELNRQFIEIYDLNEELTPEVAFEDITILKEETSIENGKLIFKSSEVFAQFMSYTVGCMFGRYSLDKEGVILANQGETLEDYLLNIEKNKDQLIFLPDDDNIIPVLDDEWFEDDIVGRFYSFLKASFGSANFDKNLAFVEECLGKDVRKYFVKDFYSDHIKQYKKRPIYWMFSSPKGSFNVLIYMHRYTPDTLNKILNEYLIQYREKLNTRVEHLDHIIVTGSSSEQTRAQKEKDKLKLVILELIDYERDILRPLAIERITIDLDEGVLVNYNKFGKAIKDVDGLNDAKTKKKVKEFDWINVEEIR